MSASRTRLTTASVARAGSRSSLLARSGAAAVAAPRPVSELSGRPGRVGSGPAGRTGSGGAGPGLGLSGRFLLAALLLTTDVLRFNFGRRPMDPAPIAISCWRRTCSAMPFIETRRTHATSSADGEKEGGLQALPTACGPAGRGVALCELFRSSFLTLNPEKLPPTRDWRRGRSGGEGENSTR